MTTGDGNRGVLAAAARINAAHARLDAVDRRVADEGLSDYPAPATDPKLAGPVLADPGWIHRRAARTLTAAGGEDLQDAAERLAAWAHPVVALSDLNERLTAWLPDDTAQAPLVRRLLCDAAGLVATPWSTHAVSVAALEAFARAAMDLVDDAELINEQALHRTAPQQGLGDVVEALSECCGFQRLFGHLAVRRNRVSLSKAALLDLGCSASRHEVAKLAGLSSEDVGLAFTTCASIVRTGYGRWAAHNDPRFVRFAAAAAELADDVGLIDEPRLKALASTHGWDNALTEFIVHAGYVRLNEQLAMSDTNRSKVKAAVKHHEGSALIEQVAETAALTVTAATSAARNIASLRLAKGVCQIVTPQRLSLAELARANADDVGVVDAARFAADAITHGHKGSLNEIAARCGLVELFGRVALKDSTAAAVKAALLDLRRPASRGELAALTRRSPKAVSHALTETASIVQVGQRWTIDTADGVLGEFAAAISNAADDVGLVNEQALRSFAHQRGWSDRFDDLVDACGLVRVEGRLALEQTDKATTKAVLADLGRPATSQELAAATGQTASAVANVLTSIASITRIRPSLWATTDLADGAYDRFGAALRLCSDDVGLINETRIREIAQQQQWKIPVDELIEDCGLPRLHGTLAMDTTAAAAAKAALLELDRPATLHELAEITGYRYGTINSALSRAGSVQRITKGARAERGLLAVCDSEEPSR